MDSKTIKFSANNKIWINPNTDCGNKAVKGEGTVKVLGLQIDRNLSSKMGHTH
jgi:hypothetical protein